VYRQGLWAPAESLGSRRAATNLRDCDMWRPTQRDAGRRIGGRLT